MYTENGDFRPGVLTIRDLSADSFAVNSNPGSVSVGLFTAFRVGGVTTQVTGRSFTVENRNDYAITFDYQDGDQNEVIAARTVSPTGVITNTSRTFTGTAGSTNENWVWVNNPITSGTRSGSDVVSGITVVRTGGTSPGTLTNAPFDITEK